MDTHTEESYERMLSYLEQRIEHYDALAIINPVYAALRDGMLKARDKLVSSHQIMSALGKVYLPK